MLTKETKYRIWLVYSWIRWKILRWPVPGTYAAMKRERVTWPPNRIDKLDLKYWGRK